jgi:hypothetical protein
MKEFFKKLFRQKKATTERNEFPNDWDLTVTDLMNELKNGKRKQIGEPELSWARLYERSLIPRNYRFPRKGDLYKSKCDQTIDYLTSWSAPYTGGGTTTLFKGEKIWIFSDPTSNKTIGTYALPVDYKNLEDRIVPYNERTAFKYNGYYFSISTKTLNENFDLIQTGFVKEKYI